MGSAPRFPVSDHCDGRRFFNPRYHVNRSWLEVLRWKLTTRPASWPARVDVVPQPPPATPSGDGAVVTWVNHATFLLQTRAGAVLFDPVWAERAGPFGWFGPRRVHAPGVRLEDLPALRAILLSHDHYDHCDLPTLRILAAGHPDAVLVAPLGHARLGRRAGFATNRIKELDWWDSYSINGDAWTIRLTPARHWSNRLHGLRNRRLWGGFSVRSGSRHVLFAGDTGHDDVMFAEIRQRCGPPDLALLPIGAYEPRWFMAAQHCNPAEAVRLHDDLGARLSLGMHWGTFPLTDEARDEPLQALQAALRATGRSEETFRTLAPGASLVI